MTTIVVARGSAWSADTLHDGWGDGVTDEQIAMLGELVVEMFEKVALSRGVRVHWLPSLSEVHGDGIDPTARDDIADILDNTREEVLEDVWDAVCGDCTPMTPRVNEIFAAEVD